MDVLTDPGCGRTMGLDMVIGNRLGLEIIMSPGVEQVSHISLLLTIFISSVLPLSATHAPVCFSFSPISLTHICSL